MNVPRFFAFPGAQRGKAAVEFSLVALFLFTILVGIFEFGRLLFHWNSAAEATRLGARLAVVCDMNDATIKSRMQAILPGLATSDITLIYVPGGCTVNDCRMVTVAIAGTSPAIQYAIPLTPRPLRIAPFTTTLTRESLVNGTGLDANPDC